MVLKYYGGISNPGNNLCEAITDSGYSSYNPKIIDDWINAQSESYLGEDWDGEEINRYIDELKNSEKDRKSTRLNSSHTDISRMPSSA